MSEQKDRKGNAKKETASRKLWHWKGRPKYLQTKMLTEGKLIDNCNIVKEQHTNINVQACDCLFNFSVKKYQLKQELEWTSHDCHTYYLISANFPRIGKKCFGKFILKTAEFCDAAEKSNFCM